MMKTKSKTAGAIVPAVLLAAWAGALSFWTAGFSAFTTYSHALSVAGPPPRQMPDFPMRDQEGRVFRFADLRGRYLLVDFMYLQCTSVCGILRSRLMDYTEELSALIPQELILVSVSFDTERDNQYTLHDAWTGAGKKEGWIFSVLGDAKAQEESARLLQELKNFGVVAVKNKTGDFNHSAYHFLVNPKGELVRVIEPAKDQTGIKSNLKEIKETVSAAAPAQPGFQ